MQKAKCGATNEWSNVPFCRVKIELSWWANAMWCIIEIPHVHTTTTKMTHDTKLISHKCIMPRSDINNNNHAFSYSIGIHNKCIVQKQKKRCKLKFRSLTKHNTYHSPIYRLWHFSLVLLKMCVMAIWWHQNRLTGFQPKPYQFNWHTLLQRHKLNCVANSLSNSRDYSVLNAF